jgi:hypothetical protein
MARPGELLFDDAGCEEAFGLGFGWGVPATNGTDGVAGVDVV